MYLPEEDSYLLSEAIQIYLKDVNPEKLKALDLGTGSGIQAETMKSLGIKNVLCSDIDDFSLNYVKKKGFKVITSNLFSKIQGKFNLITFNPPYLPNAKHDKGIDTSGGKKGDEIILRFLKQAKVHLEEQGVILLLLSSLTPKKRILELLDILRFKAEKINEKSLFFEQLEVWKIWLS